MTESPEQIEKPTDNTPEVESHFHSSSIAINHLNEVIDSVVLEAAEYADKPPEERTLPKLNRKPPPPQRQRQNMAIGDFNHARGFTGANGLNQMPFLAGGTQFQQKLHEQFPSMVPFTSSQNSVQTAAQQQLMMHYNGQYQNQSQQQRQQQQYAHFQALQNQQAQYQAVNAAALAQMQQLQRQQLQQRQQQQQQQLPNPNRHLLYSAVSTGSPPISPAVTNTLGAQQQQALASAQQQLHQLYAAAHQLPGMMQTFPPVQGQPQQPGVTVQGNQAQQPQACAQRGWSSAEQLQAAQQQQLAAAAAAVQQQQQQQYLQQQTSSQQMASASVQRPPTEFQPYAYQQ